MPFKFIVLLLSLVFSFAAYGADKAKVLKELESLYPYFSKTEIENKIEQAKNPQGFLRGFNIYFYNTLKNNPHLMGPLIRLGAEAGWCAGDAHFENFGAILDKSGKAQMTINDLDDAGPCPLIADTVKFLTSLLLEAQPVQFPIAMMAYRQGLNSSPTLSSPEVRNLLAKAEKLGPQIDPKDLKSPTSLNREENSRDCTAQEVDFITKSIKGSYGSPWNILDTYAYTKIGGGSHGLLRFRALIKNGSNLQQIQFKQLVNPGISPLLVGPMPQPTQRIKTTLSVEQGGNYSPFYTVQFLSPQMPMLMQALVVGNLEIKKESYTPAQTQNIIYDELRQLAKIHIKTASKKYVESINETSDMEWLIASRNMSQHLTEIYNVLKK